MATKRWRGDASAVVEVKTVSISGYDAATTYKLTINGKVISVVGTTDAAGTATALAAAWNNADATRYPEVAEITASSNSSTVTLTHDTAGTPFTVTSSVSGGSGTIGSVTTTTNATGPNNWNEAANWDGSGIPASTDDVVIELSTVDIKYGLDQSGVTLTSLTIASSFTGQIGLPDLNADGGYYEYRDSYLKISATTINVGDGPGTGSSRIKLNVGSVQCTLNVRNTATSAEEGRQALLWKGTHSSNAVNVSKGSVGIAVSAGETATVATLKIGYVTNVQGDALVHFGSGVTLTTVDKAGGLLTSYSAATTVTQLDGETTWWAGGLTTLVIQGGVVYYNSTGTLATATVTGSAVLDFSQDLRTKTVTNPIERYSNESKIRDPFKVVTGGGGFIVDNNQTTDLNGIEAGTNLRVTRGNPS